VTIRQKAKAGIGEFIGVHDRLVLIRTA
jgi:hypothetical protein